jgi:protease htpX homolog
MVIGLIAMILGPFMSTILQLALSRNREYLADASAVEFTRNPYGLISALTKISEAPPMTEADKKSAALYISNPFGEEGDSLFSTHPSTANRIKRLEKM